MGNIRDFSDSIKLEVIKENLRKYGGSICCESCKTKLVSIEECHFDHIYPFAKGGKSTLENCQILCSACNLRKNDKELQDFVLEEKAKQFLSGVALTEDSSDQTDTDIPEETITEKDAKGRMTKEEFDESIRNFIAKKGDIHKVDFSRPYNQLPSVWYVREYYGDLNTLKQAFGITDFSLNWTREKMIQVLLDYVSVHGDVKQKDLKKHNGLPSYPCLLKYFPEYPSFLQFKKEVLGLNVIHGEWTREEAIEAGREFVRKNGRVSEQDLKSEHGLPHARAIYRLFGSINNYQREIGAPVNDTTVFISKERIEKAVEDYFGDKERVVESRKVFFESFPIKSDIIYKRYGTFDKFCAETGIRFLKVKKASYSKKEIDDAVHNWVFSGHPIPLAKELTQVGLPSMASIMKYYENWKEPFVLYKKIYDEANRNKQ